LKKYKNNGVDIMFEMGSVVMINNEKRKYVIVGMENREDDASMSYDRTYLLKPLDHITEKEILVLKDDVLNGAYRHRIFATTSMDSMKLCEDEIPFNISQEVYLRIRKKQPKQVTVYE
jgi:hypothetical protein